MGGVKIIGNLKRREQILRVARQYYIDGIEQSQIAKREGISRTTVSRLLAIAREEGLVTITVNDHFRDAQTLANQLMNLYSNVRFTVVSTSQDDQRAKLKRVAKSAADYLNHLIKSGDIIGLGRGKSILQVAQQLAPKIVRDVEVLLLNGIFTDPVYQTSSLETASLFSKAYQATLRLLPLPIIFDSLKSKETVEQESHVRYVEKLGRVSNIAIFTLDTIQKNQFLYNKNYFSNDEQKSLSDGAVGEVLSHFIDIDGQPTVPKIDQRIVSIPLESLRYKEHSIVVVYQKAQVSILSTILRSGYVNEVFIDQQSAQLLLGLNT